MQLRLSQRAVLYRNLAQLMQAGVAPHSMVDALQRSATSPPLRSFLIQLRTAFDSGNPLSQALLQASELGFPKHHHAIVEAAERSGHVPEALVRLAGADEARHASNRELLSRSAYPILLFHFAVFAPSVAFFLSHPWRALAYALAIVIPADLALFSIYRAITSPHRTGPRHPLLRRLPFVSAAISNREAASYLGTLAQLYDAGVPILEAAKLALVAINDHHTASIYESAVAEHRDAPISNLVMTLPIPRIELVGLISAGETAGNLGPALFHSSRLLDEDATRAEARVMRLASSTLYGVVIVVVIVRVMGFYSAYLDQFSRIR